MSAEEEVLRRALEAEAGRVEISADALSVIRRRVAARRGWRRLLAPPRQVSLAFGAGVALTATPAGRAKAALTEMLERPALDPDYTSHWPGRVTVRGVAVEDDTVTVDLAGVDLDEVMDPKVADATIQQLVWTATAARPELTG